MTSGTHSGEADEEREWRELGRRLREEREYLNLSQQYVADKTGSPRSAVSDIERGVRKVDSLELRKLARLYMHPVGFFLGEEETGEDVRALARAVTDLTDQDRAEVIRFARFLRHAAEAERRKPRR
jgi:transcriptional regulator with XRE-family HTH domain